MRNPCGKKFFGEHWICFRKGGRDRRAAEKSRLKPARAKVEPALWSPKESPSLPGQDFNQNWGRANPEAFLHISSLMDIMGKLGMEK